VLSNNRLLIKYVSAESQMRIRQIKGFFLLRKPKFVFLASSKLFCKNSKRFHPKIRYRMGHDHNPLFVTFVDKLAAREYIESRIGVGYLPELYFASDKLDPWMFSQLPENVAIKVNHASGGVILRHVDINTSNLRIPENAKFPRILISPEKLSFELAANLTNKWLRTDYSTVVETGFEWAYSRIERKVFAEEFIDSNRGSMATDYKFFIFRKLCPYFLIINKQGDRIQRAIYNEFGFRLNAFKGE